MTRGKLLSGSAIYTIGGLANALIPFLLLPILTRELGVADYGLLATIQAFLGLVIPCLGFGIPAALARRFYDEELDYAQYLGANLSALVGIGALLILVSWGGALWLPFNHPVLHWSGVIAMIALVAVVSQVLLTQFQVRNLPKPFVAFTLGNTSLEVFLALVFVVALGMSWQGRLVSQALGGFTLAIAGLYWALRKGWIQVGGDYRKSADMVKDALKYGVPLIPHQLSLWAIALSDRFFVLHYHGESEVGIYTVSSQLGMGVSILVSAIATAWTPYAFERLKSRRTSDFGRTVVWILSLIALACLGFALLGPWIQSFVAGENFEAPLFLFVSLAIGQFFYAAYRIVSPVLFYAEKTRLIAVITVLTALANVILNALLVPTGGSIGAATATMISYGCSALAVFLFGKIALGKL